MTDNPSKLIRSITRDRRMFEFLIRQVVHEDICYFSYKMRRANFYHRSWRTREKTLLQSFSTNSSIPSNQTSFGFSLMRKISVRIRWWTHKNQLVCSLSSQDIPIVMKSKPLIHIMVFKVINSNGNLMPQFIPYSPRLNTEVYIKYLDQKRGYWETISSNRTLCHATQSGEPSLVWENFCNRINPGEKIDNFKIFM